MREDKIEITGTVIEVCRGGQFRCEIQAGEDVKTVIATASGKIKKFSIRIVAGDSVKIELSPYDLTKGRIVYRDRN